MSTALETGAFRLLKLELRNFKGCKSFELTPDGSSFSVYADNEIGKTTLADAHFWLLLDKDSLGRKDFGIKTIDPKTGEAIRGLDHTVYGLYQIGEKTISFEKTYKEVWTKKRGNATAEFSGHTTDYKVNDVPVQKAEYDAQIRALFDEEAIRLCGDPTYFPSALHWQKRRKLLLDICGDVSDADVIKRNRKLTDLPGFLGDRSIEDLRKIITSKRKTINDELGRIPVRIDELNRTMPEVTEGAEDVTPIREALQKLQEDRAKVAAGGAIADKRADLATINARIIEATANARAARFSGSESIRAELDRVNLALADCGSKIDVLGFAIESDREALKDLDTRLAALRREYHAKNAETFGWSGSDICASCGQQLPAGNIEEAKSKAEAAFNLAKSQALEANRAQGNSLKTRYNDLAKRIETKEAELAEWREKVPALEADRDRLGLELAAKMEAPAVASTELDALNAQKAEIEETLREMSESTTATLADIDARLANLQGSIRAAEQIAAKATQRAEAERRIAELEAQERSLAGELELLERQLFLTEEFTRTKVAALEEKINARFSLARFRLFNTLVNGAVEECCEVTVKGVPYHDLNHASKVNAGLDAIRVISDHLGFRPPIWLDGAESTTRFLPMDAQMCKLYVSKQDKTLRVELDDQLEAAA